MSENIVLMQWAGGKSRLAPQLREALDVEHKTMVEPFVGSGGLLLNRKTWNARQVINDLDVGIYSLWKIVGSSEYDRFAEIFSKFPISPEGFDRCRDIKKKGFMGCNLMKKALITYYLVVYSFNGEMTSMVYRNRPEKWLGLKEKQIRRLFDSIELAHYQAAQCEILNTDARIVINSYKDNPDALIYIDSPYVYELMGDRKDLYDIGFSCYDQIQMLEMIKKADAKICVSGYRGGSLLYDRYLNKDSGWHTYMIGEVTRSAGMCKAKQGSSHNKAKEFIWTNYVIPESTIYPNPLDLALDMDQIALYLENIHKTA